MQRQNVRERGRMPFKRLREASQFRQPLRGQSETSLMHLAQYIRPSMNPRARWGD
jgi:hypothetical protein